MGLKKSLRRKDLDRLLGVPSKAKAADGGRNQDQK